MKNKEYREIRNDEIQDIISRPPNYLIRWGTSAIGLIIFISFTGSFFFSYPDVVKGTVSITTACPPVKIVFQSAGYIKEAFKSDQEKVQKGEIIAIIDNMAETSEVLRLKKELSMAENSKNFSIGRYKELGDIENSYASFIRVFSKGSDFNKNNFEQRVALENLKNSIKQWERSYVVRSPICGTLYYKEQYNIKNQYVNKGENLFYVVNNTNKSFICKIQFRATNYHKVEVGQHVNIRVDGYPYIEYGILKGTIISITPFPENGFYTAMLRLPLELKTSSHFNIKMEGFLTGSGDIITKDLSIGNRMITPLISLFKKHFQIQLP